MPPADFSAPDWDAPLDTEERLGQVPSDRTIKGLMLKSSVEAAIEGSGKAPEGGQSYLAFKDYPLRELVELIPKAATLAFPGMNERRAVRELGRRAYFAIRASSVGKVVFAIGGRDLDGGLSLVSRIYSMVSHLTVKVTHSKPGDATIEQHRGEPHRLDLHSLRSRPRNVGSRRCHNRH